MKPNIGDKVVFEIGNGITLAGDVTKKVGTFGDKEFYNIEITFMVCEDEIVEVAYNKEDNLIDDMGDANREAKFGKGL